MEAFVFLEANVINGSAGFCVGIESTFLLCYQWTWGEHQDTWIWLLCPSQFQSSPFHDSSSKHAWELVLKLACLIFHELSWSSILQQSRRSDYLDFHPEEWQYLPSCLGLKVEVVSKSGVLTVLYSHKNSTKEVIKCHLTKYSICLDTTLLFSRLQCVLGKSITCDLRLPSPAAPKMTTRETSAFAVCWASNNDSFNSFRPLPEAMLDGRTHHPIHHGFLLQFSKSKLHVAIWFCQAHPRDASLQDDLHFVLPPPDVPDKGGSSDSESSVDTNVEIEEGQTIGSHMVVLQVQCITAGATHVICFVVELLDNDYIEWTELVLLTMATARLLYKEYHNDG
jgi:hypothetical protein